MWARGTVFSDNPNGRQLGKKSELFILLGDKTECRRQADHRVLFYSSSPSGRLCLKECLRNWREAQHVCKWMCWVTWNWIPFTCRLFVLFSRSVVSNFLRPHGPQHQASLSITVSQSLLKLMSIESVMPSNQLILCHPLLLLPSIFPSIRVFSSESALHIRWAKDWSSMVLRTISRQVSEISLDFHKMENVFFSGK